MTANATQQLAAIILGRPLAEYVAAKRSEGLGWRKLAATLEADTGGRVRVTYETLRNWYGEVAA